MRSEKAAQKVKKVCLTPVLLTPRLVFKGEMSKSRFSPMRLDTAEKNLPVIFSFAAAP
jgi:hypothetical protein